MAVKGKVALCNGVRGLNGGSTADVKNAVLVALCNGVRGLKYHWEPDEVEPIIVALCNGVRGLKCHFPDVAMARARSLECVD